MLMPHLVLVAGLLASPLLAQVLTDGGEIRLLVPRSPQVKGAISRLLLVASRETESGQACKALQVELSRQTAFQVVLPSGDDPLAMDLGTLEGMPPGRREALAARYQASHLLFLRFSRFSFKETNNNNAYRSDFDNTDDRRRNQGKALYRYHGVAKALLDCPVIDLATGSLTSLPAQNLYKEYTKEQENAAPTPENPTLVLADLTLMAARRALSMVVPVQVAQTFPFQAQGNLGKVRDTLKAGRIEEAITQARVLLQASAGESAKVQARIQYDLGLLLCLANRPGEALEVFQSARKTGADPSETPRALEACQALLAVRP